MSELLLKKRVEVRAEQDIVVLRLDTHKILLYYQTAFELGRLIRVASKQAMVYEGVVTKEWHQLSEIDSDPLPPLLHFEYRRSGVLSNLKKPCVVKVEMPLIVLHLDELAAKFHYSHGFHLQAWLRVHAKIAKAWAGDRSRSLYMTASLTDAAENYKHGYK